MPIDSIILAHGLGSASLSLRPLGWRLARQGFQVHYFGYWCAVEPYQRIVERFAELVDNQVADRPYLVVGHSLGGLIARSAFPHLSDRLPRHLVMVAPPNQPPRLAKRGQSFWLYRWFTGDCGRHLADEQFYQTLPPLPVPTTILAGTLGWYGGLSPFDHEPNDSILAVAETKLDEQTEVMTIPANHTLMMSFPQVFRAIMQIAAESS